MTRLPNRRQVQNSDPQLLTISLLKGNLEKCRELQKRLLRLAAIQEIGGVPSTSLVAMLELRGVECGYPHDPFVKVTPEIKDQIRKRLIEENLL